MDCENRKREIDEKFSRAMKLRRESKELQEEAEHEMNILKVECDHRKSNGESAWTHYYGESQCGICGKRAVHE